MPSSFRIAVILEIETDNPTLEPDTFNRLTGTVDGTAAVRAAVISTLPAGVRRVVAVTSPDLMKAMLQTHELAMEIVGMDQFFSRPPAGYEPPDGR